MNPILRKKLKILVFLALADKIFAPEEREFIKSICERHDVDPATIDELQNEPEPIGSLGALSYNKAAEYLTDIILLMLVDGQVLPGEVLFCQDIGIRLGFPIHAVDDLISAVSKQRTITRDRVQEKVLELPHRLK